MTYKMGKKLSTILLFSSSLAVAQDFKTSQEIETSCRIKAKEVAANTYRTCVLSQKNSQIEQIKKDYQTKLKSLKAHYESELKKMVGSKKAAEKLNSDNTEKSTSPSEEKNENPVNEEVNSAESEGSAMEGASGSHSEETNSETSEMTKGEAFQVENQEKPSKTAKTASGKKSLKQKNTSKSLPTKNSLASSPRAKLKKQMMAETQTSQMSIQLKKAPATGPILDASGDIPEPIPVELSSF